MTITIVLRKGLTSFILQRYTFDVASNVSIIINKVTRNWCG